LDERRFLAVAKTPRQPRHSLGDGVALARGSLGRRGGYGELCGLVAVVLAADGVLERAETAAHRAADLRKPLRTEEEKRQKQEEDNLPGADIRHGRRVARFEAREREQTRRDGQEEATGPAGRRRCRRLLRT